MKISRFNTRDASNVPQKLSLVDPFTGETIIDEKERTLDFYIYGIQSDVARNAMKARDRKYGKGKNLTDDQSTQSGAEFLAALTQGWSDNIEDDDGPIPYSKETAIELYKNEDWIARQVSDFSMNLTNYDPKRLSESVFGSDNSPGSTRPRKSKSGQEEKS
jgi:hypothetical protein